MVNGFGGLAVLAGNSFGFLNLSLEQIVIGQHYPIQYSCTKYSHQLQELLLEYLHHDKIGLRLGYLC
jgi:hypothetical protein|tara:strand:+ start:146 stop:346 length:201 start_codon:yes stop_codon:yes gene_type:complete